jgi:DNA-binding XRE family transcriptional regulator
MKKASKRPFELVGNRMVTTKTVKVEVRRANNGVIFEVPGPDFARFMAEWTAKYPFVPFNTGDYSEGVALRVPWEEDIPSKINEKIRYYRKKMKLTQVELAERSGTTQANIASAESGSRPVGKEFAVKLGKALGVDYRVFL